MSNEAFEVLVPGSNPYMMAPANNVSMTDAPRHESGNALAANAEARAVAEVKAQMFMARQLPRDPARSVANMLRECERPSLAEKAVYTFPRGNETVSGPSIRLAEMMARNWGNCMFGLEVLERKPGIGKTPGQSVIRAYAWDLETNTYTSRQFELKHWRATRSGGYALTDDRDIYELEANMGSRRMRACILQMLPGDVTQAAVDKCRMVNSEGLSDAMKDPKRRAAMLEQTIKVFEKRGISQADLEDYIGVRSTSWTADHAMRIKELKTSLDDGVISIGDVFPHLAGGGRNDTITKEQAEELMVLAKQTGRQGDISKALKQMGIAKIADTPADRYDEVKLLVSSLLKQAKESAPAHPEQATMAVGDDVPPWEK